MALTLRELATILNSGEITTVYLGGTESTDAVVKQGGLDTTNTRVTALENPSTESAEFVATSLASSQMPTGTDAALQIEFGAEQVEDNATIAANGTITFHTSEEYHIEMLLHLGRTGGSGTSEVFGRLLKNDVQIACVFHTRLDNADVVVPIHYTKKIAFEKDDTLKAQIIRDSGGNDSGGLISATPTANGWSLAPSACMTVTKHI